MIRSATWMVDRDWTTAAKLPQVVHCLTASSASSPGRLVSSGVIRPVPTIAQRLTGFKTIIHLARSSHGAAYAATETYLMALGRTEVTLTATTRYSSLAGADHAAATRLKREAHILASIARRSKMRD